jgi:hypothetical protein
MADCLQVSFVVCGLLSQDNIWLIIAGYPLTGYQPGSDSDRLFIFGVFVVYAGVCTLVHHHA